MGIFDKLFGKKGSSSMSSGTPRATEKCHQCFESDFTFMEKIDADQDYLCVMAVRGNVGRKSL